MTKKIKPKTDKEAEKATEAEAKANEEKEAEAKKAAEAEAMAAAVQDEFQARGFELVEWVHHNPTVIVGVIAIVLLGGLGIGVWTVVDRGNNTKASAAYAAAQKLWEAPIGEDTNPDDDIPAYKDVAERAKAARTAFTGVATQHKGSGAGILAQLTIGHASLKLGEIDAAIAAYNAFLAGTKPKDELRFAGYAGLAAALDAKGDTKGAIKALEDEVALADKTDEDGALLSLGRLYVQDGDPVKAKAKLELLIEDFPESSLKARADELLATLGGPTKKDDAPKKDDEKKKL
ncbi:MAG: tetratricopeptide repeat protein [Deltaproteobacteria bacterium]|nr:tetratricopeptide repeat protein [Deltaproteobacteria bacterium]